MLFKIVGDDIIYKNVKVATFNRILPSFRDEVENVIKNNFYSSSELTAMRDLIKEEAVDKYKQDHDE